MERLNVMIVDDSSVGAHLVNSMLTNLGHKVVRTARTGTEAVIAYSTCNPDVVLMDITMPDMDGIAATKKIVTSYPDARIVIVSSHSERDIVLKAQSAGAKGYLLKPIHPDKLRTTLENVVRAEAKMVTS